MFEDIKQAIIVRNDLKMSIGKLVAQSAHASLMSYLETMKSDKKVCEQWIKSGEKKIVLKLNSEKELVDIYKEFKKMGMPCALVVDAGLTELKPGTKTAVGAGPWPSEDIDQLTSELKLL